MKVRIIHNHSLFNWFCGVILIITALTAMIGCNDKLSVVGNNLLSDTLQLTSINSSDSLPLITGSSSFSKSISLSGVGYVFIGKTSTSEALTLSRIAMPDSVPDLNVADIISAKLFISASNPYYAFGDTTNNQLSFSVVKVLKLWGTTATRDSITPDYFDSKPLATYNGKIPLRDSTGTFTVDFDKDQVIEWFSLRRKLGSGNDSLNYGIAFRANSDCNIIRRFSAGSVGNAEAPQFTSLQVVYRRTTDTNSTVITIPSSYEGTYVTTPNPTEKSITIQGVSAIHSQISFDVSSIPKGVAIHLAGLTLTLDPSRSEAGTAGTDAAVYAEFIDSTSNNLVRTYYGARSQDANGNYTNEYFFPSLNSALEAMVRRNGIGTITLQTQPANYYKRMDKLVFFGAQESDSTKRPRMTVVYSTRPKF
ncbi:MAG: hypothetical protein JST20_13035 [Bacteroidetes bacterium]|nr:hypothetical protein [Bacteroidota bacterium]